MIRVYSCFYLAVKLISEIQKLIEVPLVRDGGESDRLPQPLAGNSVIAFKHEYRHEGDPGLFRDQYLTDHVGHCHLLLSAN
jgi:hypothetical protein